MVRRLVWDQKIGGSSPPSPTETDEYEKTIGKKSPATFTGKPVELGGSLGRTKATGRDEVIVLENLVKQISKDYQTVAVQGFGNVGYHFAKITGKTI